MNIIREGITILCEALSATMLVLCVLVVIVLINGGIP